MALSSMQLARLVQAYVAEPGPSLEEKATRVGVRRNELLRAARGTISRTTRLRLLVFFAAAGARRDGVRAPLRVSALIVSGNGGLHERNPPPGGARRSGQARWACRRHSSGPAVVP